MYITGHYIPARTLLDITLLHIYITGHYCTYITVHYGTYITGHYITAHTLLHAALTTEHATCFPCSRRQVKFRHSVPVSKHSMRIHLHLTRPS